MVKITTVYNFLVGDNNEEDALVLVLMMIMAIQITIVVETKIAFNFETFVEHLNS